MEHFVPKKESALEHSFPGPFDTWKFLFFYTIKENLHLLSKMAGLATFTHVVLTMVKTGLGKTPKNHMSWAKLGKTNFLNSKNSSCFRIFNKLVRIV